MQNTVIAIFDSERVAKEAVEDLRNAGFDREISVLAKGNENEAGQEEQEQTMNIQTEDANPGNENYVGDGTSTGGVLGGLAGLAVGAGALVIPGLGPVIAAGPVAGLLSGAATGGVAGALIDYGISEEEGKYYEEQIKQGKIMVSVNTDEEHIDGAQQSLKDHGADEVKIYEK